MIRGWIDRIAVLRLGDQPGALDLRLALRPRKGMPAAFALTLCVVSINDDGPMARRPFANVAFHDLLSSP